MQRVPGGFAVGHARQIGGIGKTEAEAVADLAAKLAKRGWGLTCELRVAQTPGAESHRRLRVREAPWPILHWRSWLPPLRSRPVDEPPGEPEVTTRQYQGAPQ